MSQLKLNPEVGIVDYRIADCLDDGTENTAVKATIVPAASDGSLVYDLSHYPEGDHKILVSAWDGWHLSPATPFEFNVPAAPAAPSGEIVSSELQ